MATLNSLTPIVKAHWTLHLNAAKKDLPALSTTITNYLKGNVQLPNIKHPAYIHDWLEADAAQRKVIEAWNG